MRLRGGVDGDSDTGANHQHDCREDQLAHRYLFLHQLDNILVPSPTHYHMRLLAPVVYRRRASSSARQCQYGPKPRGTPIEPGHVPGRSRSPWHQAVSIVNNRPYRPVDVDPPPSSSAACLNHLKSRTPVWFPSMATGQRSTWRLFVTFSAGLALAEQGRRAVGLTVPSWAELHVGGKDMRGMKWNYEAAQGHGDG